MKLVLDASVAIASISPGEPDYAAARARVSRALQGSDDLVEPAIFRIEVGGALVRRGRQRADIRKLVAPLCAPPHAIVTIGPKRAAAAEALAIQAKLRGAEAIYVWLAAARALPLCTLDREMATRAAPFCQVVSP